MQQQDQQNESEIRIKANMFPKAYINRAATLLLRDQVQLQEGESKQAPLDHIIFQASGQAIHTALVAADVIRRKIPNLHQVNRIQNITVSSDRTRKNSDGQEYQETERNLVIFEVLLHKKPTEAMKKEAGYIGVLKHNDKTEYKLADIVFRRENNRAVRNYNSYNKNDRDHDPKKNHENRRHYEGGNQSNNQYSNYRRSNRKVSGDDQGRGQNAGRTGNYRENFQGGRRNNNNGGGRNNNY